MKRVVSGTMEAVAPRLEPILKPPILFAHRGASAHAPENTLEAFALALTLGANGLESDVWVSADGSPILDHDGKVGSFGRRRSISYADRVDLPAHMPTLPELFGASGTDFDLSLDIKDPRAIEPTVNALRDAEHATSSSVVQRTWLCHPDLATLVGWRQRWSDVRLVHSTRLSQINDGPERHASMLYEKDIDAVNFRHMDWTGGLTSLYHRFGRACFGWDAQLERVASELLNMGIDAIYSNHVDRMCSARDRVYRR